MTAPTFEETLRSLLSEAGVTPTVLQIIQLKRYWTLLQRWNDRMNLTSLPLDPTSVPTINRLFIEPAVASSLVEDTRLLTYDLGSGGGSPAIPLHIFRSELQLTMVESRERKCAFLREAVREVGLDAVVLTTRFEDLQMDPQTDLVTLRAVRLDGSLVSLLHGQLKQGARVMVFGAKETPPLFRPVEFCQLPSGSYVTVLVKE